MKARSPIVLPAALRLCSFLCRALAISFIVISSLLPTPAGSATVPPIIINEVAWMGSAESHANEWIEFFNTTENPLLLNGWTMTMADGKFRITLKGTVPPKGFFLLERSDDTSVPSEKADLIYRGSLPNDGRGLILYNDSHETIDSIEASWPAGDNITKQTMERSPDLTWHTSEKAGGTPKRPNSSGPPKPPVSDLPKEAKSDKRDVTEAQKNNLSLASSPSFRNPWWLLGGAGAMALVSGVTLFIIKIRKRS